MLNYAAKLRSRPRTGVNVLILALSMSWALVASGQPSRVPVPAKYLSGNTLTIPEANFSVAAPGKAWHWERMISEHTASDSLGHYVCVNAETNEFYLVTHLGGKAKELNDQMLAGTLDALRDRSPDGGASLHYEVTDLPAPGTIRCDYLQAQTDTGPLRAYTYFVITGTSVSLSTFVQADHEPAQFTEFVKSFRLLKPIPAEAPAPAIGSSAPGYFVVLCLAAGVTNYVDRKKSVRRNPFKVGTWVVAIVAVAELVLVAVLIKTRNITDTYGRLRMVASVFSGAALPLIVGMILALRKPPISRCEPPTQPN